MIRPCLSCSRPFETPWSRHKYCSQRCVYEAHVVRRSRGCWGWNGVKNAAGYGVMHSLRINGERSRLFAHRFSYEINFSFIPEGLYVCHRCDNPECTRPSHLFLGTTADNTHDSMRKGRNSPPPRAPQHFQNKDNWKRGSGHYAARLTEDQVREIRGSSERTTDVAERFGVAKTTISMIRRGRTWKHLAIGDGGKARASLTEDDVRAIRNSHETSTALAERYGVTARNIRKVRSGERWQQVT